MVDVNEYNAVNVNIGDAVKCCEVGVWRLKDQKIKKRDENGSIS
jgi:hypothetical protein